MKHNTGITSSPTHSLQVTARTQAGSLTLTPELLPGFTVAKSTPVFSTLQSNIILPPVEETRFQ